MRRAAVLAVSLALATCLALGAAGCGGTVNGASGKSHRHHQSSPAATSSATATSSGATSVPPSTSSSSTTTTAPTGTDVAGITAAVAAYQRDQGVSKGEYLVGGIRVSSADRTWAEFSVVPAAGYANALQGGYGFAHLENGQWRVVAAGNAEVGCPPGPTVPRQVLRSAGLSCQAQ